MTVISVMTSLTTAHNSTINIIFALISCALVIMVHILLAYIVPIDLTKRGISKAVIVLVAFHLIGAITWISIDRTSRDRNDPIVSSDVVFQNFLLNLHLGFALITKTLKITFWIFMVQRYEVHYSKIDTDHSHMVHY